MQTWPFGADRATSRRGDDQSFRFCTGFGEGLEELAGNGFPLLGRVGLVCEVVAVRFGTFAGCSCEESLEEEGFSKATTPAHQKQLAVRAGRGISALERVRFRDPVEETAGLNGGGRLHRGTPSQTGA